MKSDFKIMMGALVFTFVLIVGLASVMGGKGEEDTPPVLGQAEGIEANPSDYQLGDIPINGGIVTKEYEVKNTTGNSVMLKKIVTSCMCTQAKVSVNGQETKYFGMEHATDKNAPVNLEVPAGETAKVTVNFDPAAHGPQGKGPFDRVVWLTFSDPGGVTELTFSGTVVN